jgi:hypothetical protein
MYYIRFIRPQEVHIQTKNCSFSQLCTVESFFLYQWWLFRTSGTLGPAPWRPTCEPTQANDLTGVTIATNPFPRRPTWQHTVERTAARNRFTVEFAIESFRSRAALQLTWEPTAGKGRTSETIITIWFFSWRDES